MLADVLLAAKDWAEAKKQLDQLRSSHSDEKHGFADTAMGILCLNTAPPEIPLSKRSVHSGGHKAEASEQEKKRDGHINRAIEHFKKALAPSGGGSRSGGGGGPQNAYAANGVGCCLAMREQFADAKEAFSMVSEAAAAERSAAGGTRDSGYAGKLSTAESNSWVNTAHVHLANGETAAARRMYERYLEVHGGGVDDEVLLCLARTLHDAGEQREAIRALRRAIHLKPGDIRMRFDLAYELQECGSLAFRLYGEPDGWEKNARDRKDRKRLNPIEALDAVKEAKCMEEQALAILLQLQTVAEGEDEKAREAMRLGLDTIKLKMHIDYCVSLMKNADNCIAFAEKRAEDYKLKLNADRLRAEHLAAKARVEEEKEKEAKRLEEQRREKAARDAAEKMASARAHFILEHGDDKADESEKKEKKEKKKKKKKRRREEKEVFEEEGEEDEEENEEMHEEEDQEGDDAEKIGKKLRKKSRLMEGEQAAQGDEEDAEMQDDEDEDEVLKRAGLLDSSDDED